jgi:D-alanyl-D-alanine carboxypeptidase
LKTARDITRLSGILNQRVADSSPAAPIIINRVVQTTAKELRLPSAMVLLRTPKGEFAFGYGATELGGTIPPRADAHFRAASNTKTMTAAVIVLLVQEEKLRFDDPVSKYVQGVRWGYGFAMGRRRGRRW